MRTEVAEHHTSRGCTALKNLGPLSSSPIPHPHHTQLQRPKSMATPVIVGVGAIAAALAGRHFLRRAGQGAADQWVRGGFKAKMDRKEAIAILGLKYVL